MKALICMFIGHRWTVRARNRQGEKIRCLRCDYQRILKTAIR